MTTRQAGVLGRPIEHSLSPVLHRAAYAALGLPWTYHALDCGVEELPGVVAARADWAGFSCTMPLKHAALGVAAEVSDLAAAVGAANTLLPTPGGWRADNTDVTGVAAALRPHVTGSDAVAVLGGGGTAQAAVAAAQQLGLAGCTVLLRDPARADQVLGTAERVGIGLTIGRLAPDAVELRERVVVAALPPGAADPLADRHWRPDQVVLDVVYAGWPTRLAAAAAAGGATALSGASVLLFQAATQLTLMTGRDAPVEAMRAALLAAAPGCGA